MGRRAYTAELIGTFALVFFGSVSVTVFIAILGTSSPSASFLAIAMAHGFILMVMVYAVGQISGCHINPAITISAVALRKMDVDDGVAYLVAQIVGAALAGLAHQFILPESGKLTNFGSVAPGISIGRDPLVAVVVELIITFFLMFSFYAAGYTGKVAASGSGVLVGMTYAVDVLIAGPLTGGAANPARALGPAIASGAYRSLWIYWVGPVIGALVAGFVFEYLLVEERPARTRRS
jgi:MIP family channel proteins